VVYRRGPTYYHAMERIGTSWAQVLGVAVAVSTLLTVLALVFPDPTNAITDVLGPVFLFAGSIGFLLGFGILWNGHWKRP
jgi:hypothetical protein